MGVLPDERRWVVVCKTHSSLDEGLEVPLRGNLLLSLFDSLSFCLPASTPSPRGVGRG